MMKVGIVGCGAIGTILARAIEDEMDNVCLGALNDIVARRAELLSASLKSRPPVLDLGGIVDRSDLVVECACKDSVGDVVSAALDKKKDVLVMSVSGLIDYPDIFEFAREKGCVIYVPSGAIAGIDGLKAAKSDGIASVVLTTTKPKEGLAGAPYIARNKIDLSAIRKKTLIFEGDVFAAIRGFPGNVNVSATLALAGIGPGKTRVRIVVDPESRTNCHEVKITGDFGEITARTKNVPCPDNPKTSYLAALSLVAKIKDIAGNVNVGT